MQICVDKPDVILDINDPLCHLKTRITNTPKSKIAPHESKRIIGGFGESLGSSLLLLLLLPVTGSSKGSLRENKYQLCPSSLSRETQQHATALGPNSAPTGNLTSNQNNNLNRAPSKNNRQLSHLLHLHLQPHRYWQYSVGGFFCLSTGGWNNAEHDRTVNV